MVRNLHIYITIIPVRRFAQMKTVNISLADAEHKRLSELKELLNLSNLHETVAKMIDITYETLSKRKDRPKDSRINR